MAEKKTGAGSVFRQLRRRTRSTRPVGGVVERKGARRGRTNSQGRSRSGGGGGGSDTPPASDGMGPVRVVTIVHAPRFASLRRPFSALRHCLERRRRRPLFSLFGSGHVRRVVVVVVFIQQYYYVRACVLTRRSFP